MGTFTSTSDTEFDPSIEDLGGTAIDSMNDMKSKLDELTKSPNLDKDCIRSIYTMNLMRSRGLLKSGKSFLLNLDIFISPIKHF